MKFFTHEILWHSKEPIYSACFQPTDSNVCRLVTAGADRCARLWKVCDENGRISVEFLASMERLSKAANCARFAPSGQWIAVAGDDCEILIWRQRAAGGGDEAQRRAESLGEDEAVDSEHWVSERTLRGHLEEVYDLAWAPDSTRLVSGSVDNTAIVWDVRKGARLLILREAKSFVQGVAWDPTDKLIATMSVDRCLRLYDAKLGNCVQKVTKPNVEALVEAAGKVAAQAAGRWGMRGDVRDAADPEAGADGARDNPKPQQRLFHDDTGLFFRRLAFSPDGRFLLAPSGFLAPPNLPANANADDSLNCCYLFRRSDWKAPVAIVPHGGRPSLAVTWCPRAFNRRSASADAAANRWLFAIATEDSVILYDTEQLAPFAYFSSIHYLALTDLSWSANAQYLVISSADGYCSIVHFDVERDFGGDAVRSLPNAVAMETVPNDAPAVATTTASNDTPIVVS